MVLEIWEVINNEGSAILNLIVRAGVKNMELVRRKGWF